MTRAPPLIRIGFPIFDRHHHHRRPVWGLSGRHERPDHHPRQDLRTPSTPTPTCRRRPTTRSTSSVDVLDPGGLSRPGFSGCDREPVRGPARPDLQGESQDFPRSDTAPLLKERSMSSLSSTIQAVFNEPGCGKNQTSPKPRRRRGAPSSCSPVARPVAALSTAPRSRFSPSPTSPISCTAPSPAKAIPGIIAAPSRPAPTSGGPASPPTSTRPTWCSAAKSACSSPSRKSSRNTILRPSSSTRPACPP